MQKQVPISERGISRGDILVMLFLGAGIYAVVSLGQLWRTDFHAATAIDLSPWALPKYAFFSAIRGIIAYWISLVFSLVVGYTAARSQNNEQVLVPVLDILQSIPVLGFLPGLVLGLIALFPHTNMGLELACVLLIFTGQVWNMTFSVYESMKSIPQEFVQAASLIGLSRWKRFTSLELPYAAVGLAWNSVLSMAGGWNFLVICEAFTLGAQEFRLPGIGAYMAEAATKGDSWAQFWGVIMMIVVILLIDQLVWRPVLTWVQRYRVEESLASVGTTAPLMTLVLRESRIIASARLAFRRWNSDRRLKKLVTTKLLGPAALVFSTPMVRTPSAAGGGRDRLTPPTVGQALRWIALGFLSGAFLYLSWRLLKLLLAVPPVTWIILVRDTVWTSLRVFLAVGLSTLWALPVGVWIGISAKRVRLAQPVIQVLASFPAPMLYPAILALLFALGVNFHLGSMILMFVTIVWYVLFNVLAGAIRIPRELDEVLSLMPASRWRRWRSLYFPAVFPSLVTGWVTAAGGAWNTSIVAEYFSYQQSIYKTAGLGATISAAAAAQDFPTLAASLTLMVAVVLLLNRFVWRYLYDLARNRFRMET